MWLRRATAGAMTELDRRQTELAQSNLLPAVVGYDQHGASGMWAEAAGRGRVC